MYFFIDFWGGFTELKSTGNAPLNTTKKWPFPKTRREFVWFLRLRIPEDGPHETPESKIRLQYALALCGSATGLI
jgi:hypothetical protein